MQQITIAGIGLLSSTLPNEVYYTTDPGKEGFWKFDLTDTSSAENIGTILKTSAPLPSARLKRVIEDYVKPEWFGDINGSDDATYLQKAIDIAYVVNVPVRSNVKLFSIKKTINLHSSSLIEMENIALTAHADFVGTEMLRITGSSAQGFNYVRIILDGVDKARNITGATITQANTSGSELHFLVRNLGLGVHVIGNTERQNINVSCFSCKIALKEEALLNLPGSTATRTPNENFYHVNGGDCETWFHQLGTASSQVTFNCENTTQVSPVPGYQFDYAVVIEGNYNCRLLGEIRGCHNGGIRVKALTKVANPGGGESIVPGSSLNVQMDITAIIVENKPALYVETCRSLTGTFAAEKPTGGGVFLGKIDYGTILNLNLKSIGGGPALQLGRLDTVTPANSLAFKCGIINLIAAPMREISTGVYPKVLVIENASTTEIKMSEYVSSVIATGIELKGNATNINIELNSLFIKQKRQFVNTSGQIPSVRITGALTSAELSGYTSPQSGMVAQTVTDKGFNSALYNGTQWVYDQLPFNTSAEIVQTLIGSAVGNGVSQTFSIPHGLGSIPSWIGIPSAKNVLTGQAGVVYVDADSTNIMIHTNNIPANLVSLQWNLSYKK